MKKTIKISDLIDHVNYSLDKSICSDECRYGMIAVLEWVLHESGNYIGYNHILEGQICSYKEQPDNSRRFYYKNRNL